MRRALVSFRWRVCLAAMGIFLLAPWLAPPGALPPVWAATISYNPPQCEALLTGLHQDQAQQRYEAEWDESTFWTRIGYGGTFDQGRAKLLQYLWNYDGTYSPLRSGSEVQLCWASSKWAAPLRST